MREIGGYIEYEYSRGKMLHDDAVLLNCGRRALSYLIKSRDIKEVWVPKFTCGSVIEPFEKESVDVCFYSIGTGFRPEIDNIPSGEWLVIINYYGQISNEQIIEIRNQHPKLIVDNTQAYYQMPVPDVDTVYTCRKFFGVADGAVLYTNSTLKEEFKKDESFKRMAHIMGRFERTASEFYEMYDRNNSLFDHEPIKQMSKLTHNILCGIDYDFVCKTRTANFWYLDEKLRDINRLKLSVPDGAFMYPLYTDNGANIRKQLIDKHIYIPTLWPDVFTFCDEKDLECDMARNILPLPVDQRYGIEDMEYIVSNVMEGI